MKLLPHKRVPLGRALVGGKGDDRVLLGIDGGASKTAGVAISRGGRVLARARQKGSAIVGSPKPESCAVLASVVDDLCAQSGRSRGSVVRCGIGLNGVDFADEIAMQHAQISRAIGLPPERVGLVNDGIVALWGATSAPAAVMVQHGSGFTAAYRSVYGAETLFDHLSVAQVFDLRQGLISLVARMLNGMAEATPLKEKALAHFGVDEDAYCDAIFRGLIPRERRMSTGPLIFASWVEGDAGADSLVGAALDDYALAAKAMIAKTRSPSPAISLGGGLLSAAPPRFWDALTERLKGSYPGVVARPPRLAPEFGAAIMAGHEAGLDPRVLFDTLAEQLPTED
ncbi:MAG: BadF/BadG/BcrA/BcrD ATPase family protein [Armatimonadota bacterium]